MKKESWDILYDRHKNRKIFAFYTELLCELLLLRFEFSFDNIMKKDILKELPSLREFTSKDVENIYQSAIKMLDLKYNVLVLQENPFVFKDNRPGL